MSTEPQLSLHEQFNNKKEDYIRRVRALPDHVEIIYPDGGLYIGQNYNHSR